MHTKLWPESQAAWIGLTPLKESSGDKRHLGSITKQGDQTLRRLLVLGATAWLSQVERHPEKVPQLAFRESLDFE